MKTCLEGANESYGCDLDGFQQQEHDTLGKRA